MKTYFKGDYFCCPFCKIQQCEPIEDFVVPKRYKRCISECENCDKNFSVTEYEPEKFIVSDLNLLDIG